MHSLGGLFRCLHQALNFLSVRPPSTSASRRGWEPNFGLPLHGVSLYLIVLDKLFQVLICLGEVCNFDLCELLEHLLREPHGCLLKQEEATVLELKNIRRGFRCSAILRRCRVFSRTASRGILAGHVLWLHRQGARRHLEQTLQ